MTSAEITHLRVIYGELCRGYSKLQWDGKPVFVKHFNSFDQTEIDMFYDKVLAETVARGIQSEAKKLEWLNQKGWWTKANQDEVDRDRGYVTNLQKTKSQLAVKVQRDAIDAQLQEAATKLNKMLKQRSDALGRTAEWVADQKIQYEYIRQAFFSDVGLTQPLFTQEDTSQFSEDEAEVLVSLYIEIVQRFSQDNLRHIAVQPFFTNSFYLCDKDVSTFFGKPIVNLTIQQVNLLSHGMYFKSIFTDHAIPPPIAQDPDKIEDFINRSKAGKALIANTPAQGHRVGIIGAQAEDFEAMGIQDGTKTMREAAAKEYQTGRDAAKDLGVNWN